MSKPKLTPWFPGHIKPVRPGVYETDARTIESRCFQHWNGHFWGVACDNPHEAKAIWSGYRSMFQKDRWRGLAEQPK